MTPIEYAISKIGVEEDPRGSNWGDEIKEFLASVNIHFPASWCMAFVYWCVEQSNVRIPDGTGGLKNPLMKTASVMLQWNKVELQFPYARHKGMKVTDPKPGDIFIMDFGNGTGHTGFVEEVGAGGLLHTIEGNTNDTGSREGYEVCRRKRKVTSMKGFIRLP